MARVVSVNISATRAFRKGPRPVARLLAAHGFEGDYHAGRAGRHVSLLDVETIRDLAGQGMPVEPGALAENVTLEGVPLMHLPAGTRLRLGPEAEVEITGDRPVCRELLQVHREALKALVGRNGKLAAVVRGGEVRPGDTVEVLAPAAASL